ncbi:unnamed protein product [Owenia fusiformis]|uniref:Uncharacterized protein n=1 Tax=Owenia fusiformis TaxID=6347 RepID=A0A8S4PI14_OWEFU|nr:unnamed protein product [Owenia fusiformis]
MSRRRKLIFGVFTISFLLYLNNVWNFQQSYIPTRIGTGSYQDIYAKIENINENETHVLVDKLLYYKLLQMYATDKLIKLKTSPIGMNESIGKAHEPRRDEKIKAKPNGINENNGKALKPRRDVSDATKKLSENGKNTQELLMKNKTIPIKNDTKGKAQKQKRDVSIAANGLSKNAKNTQVVIKKTRPIFFLKTHKTGSSTIQNILMRYADKHNLTLALPSKGRYLFKYWHPFKNDSVMPLVSPNGTYDIMCHHLVYSKEVKQILPKDVYSLTILREPKSLFVSSYNFFGFGGKLCNRTVNEYLEMSIPDEVPLKSRFKTIKSNSSKCNPCTWVRHGVLYDFGLPYDEIDDRKKLSDIILKFDKEFDFVMILEYIDECLVMLKNQFGWTMEDILYIKQNEASSSNKTLKYLSAKSKKKLDVFLYQEHVMYDYFNKSLWRRIDTYGRERLSKEVNLFRKLRSDADRSCISHRTAKINVPDDLLKPCCNFLKGYVLKPGKRQDWLCRRLAAAEWAYTDLLRRRLVRDKVIQ